MTSVQAINKLPEAPLRDALGSMGKALKDAFEMQGHEMKEQKRVDIAKKEVRSSPHFTAHHTSPSFSLLTLYLSKGHTPCLYTYMTCIFCKCCFCEMVFCGASVLSPPPVVQLAKAEEKLRAATEKEAESKRAVLETRADPGKAKEHHKREQLVHEATAELRGSLGAAQEKYHAERGQRTQTSFTRSAITWGRCCRASCLRCSSAASILWCCCL